MEDRLKHLNSLEFEQVLQLLANEATIALSKEKALCIEPFDSMDEVNTELKKTEEAFLLSAKYASPSFGSPEDPSPLLTRCDAGSTLTMSELLAIANCLRIIRTVKEWRENISDSSVVVLNDLFSALVPNKFLEDTINSAIKNNEELYDNASPKLFDIRRNKVKVSSLIKSKLDVIVKNRQKAKFLQDAIVTQRDGRYVVPVKVEFKSEIQGIVHDTSSSGATLFVEPMPVVEANNELRVLMSQEREEIERILTELSVKVSEFHEQIRNSFNILVDLNLIFAKASLAYKMRATVPQIDMSGHILLKNARHPLIDRKKVVPISVSLGIDYNSLIITGPNTGGKTVSLKTIGLLTSMTMCGLMIPADDGSHVSFYKRILVDIGDEQSIEQSLSTFSSHICNIIKIIDKADEQSLVLLDEIGAGTDPVEGAALAKAILIKLSQNGAKVVATTHYPELKSYAIETSDVENASCEFDVANLKPTYRLMIGVPGKSNAFAISSKLGVSEEILESAKSFISQRERDFDKIAEVLEKARQEAESEKLKTESLNVKLKEKLNSAELLLKDAESKSEKLLDKAKNDAAYIIDNARYKSNALITELEAMKKQFNIDNAADLLNRAKKSSSSAINDMEKTADPVADKQDDNYILPRELISGDTVLLRDIGSKATVEKLSADKLRAFVSMGAISTWTDVSNLRLLEKEKANKSEAKGRRVTGVTSRAERSAGYEIDMRGMTVDEGIMELDRYIDQAVLSGIPSVTIIHGKGTGALRKAVHDFLKHNKHIKYFRLGVFGEGEAGVTIAELKS